MTICHDNRLLPITYTNEIEKYIKKRSQSMFLIDTMTRWKNLPISIQTMHNSDVTFVIMITIDDNSFFIVAK